MKIYVVILLLIEAVSAQYSEETIPQPTSTFYPFMEVENRYIHSSSSDNINPWPSRQQSVSMLDMEMRYKSLLYGDMSSIDNDIIVVQSQSLILTSIQPTSTRIMPKSPLLLMPYSDSIEPSFTATMETPIIRSLSQYPEIDDMTEKLLLPLKSPIISYDSIVLESAHTDSFTSSIPLVTPISSFMLFQSPDPDTAEMFTPLSSMTALDSILFDSNIAQTISSQLSFLMTSDHQSLQSERLSPSLTQSKVPGLSPSTTFDSPSMKSSVEVLSINESPAFSTRVLSAMSTTDTESSYAQYLALPTRNFISPSPTLRIQYDRSTVEELFPTGIPLYYSTTLSSTELIYTPLKTLVASQITPSTLVTHLPPTVESKPLSQPTLELNMLASYSPELSETQVLTQPITENFNEMTTENLLMPLSSPTYTMPLISTPTADIDMESMLYLSLYPFSTTEPPHSQQYPEVSSSLTMSSNVNDTLPLTPGLIIATQIPSLQYSQLTTDIDDSSAYSIPHTEVMNIPGRSMNYETSTVTISPTTTTQYEFIVDTSVMTLPHSTRVRESSVLYTNVHETSATVSLPSTKTIMRMSSQGTLLYPTPSYADMSLAISSLNITFEETHLFASISEPQSKMEHTDLNSYYYSPETSQTLLYTTFQFHGTSDLLNPFQSEFVPSTILSPYIQTSLHFTKQTSSTGMEHFRTTHPSIIMTYAPASPGLVTKTTDILIQPSYSPFPVPTSDLNPTTIGSLSIQTGSLAAQRATLSESVTTLFTTPLPILPSAIEPTPQMVTESQNTVLKSTVSIGEEFDNVTLTIRPSEYYVQPIMTSILPNSITNQSEARTFSFALQSTVQSSLAVGSAFSPLLTQSEHETQPSVTLTTESLAILSTIASPSVSLSSPLAVDISQVAYSNLLMTSTTLSSEYFVQPTVSLMFNNSVMYQPETEPSSLAIQSSSQHVESEYSPMPTPSKHTTLLLTDIIFSSEPSAIPIFTSAIFVSMRQLPTSSQTLSDSISSSTAYTSKFNVYMTSELRGTSVSPKSTLLTSVSSTSTSLGATLITTEIRNSLTSTESLPSPSPTESDSSSRNTAPFVSFLQSNSISKAIDQSSDTATPSHSQETMESTASIFSLDLKEVSTSGKESSLLSSTGTTPSVVSIQTTTSSTAVYPSQSSCHPYSNYAVKTFSIVSIYLAIPPADLSKIKRTGSIERCILLNDLVMVFKRGLEIKQQVLEVAKRDIRFKRQRKIQKRQAQDTAEYIALITGIEEANDVGNNLVNVMFSILEISNPARPQQVDSTEVSEAFEFANVHELRSYTIVRIAQPAQVTKPLPTVEEESNTIYYRTAVGSVVGAVVLVTLVVIIILLVAMSSVWKFRHRKKFTLQVHPQTNHLSILSRTLIPTNSFEYESQLNVHTEISRSQLQGLSVSHHDSEEQTISSSSHGTPLSRSVTTLAHLAEEQEEENEVIQERDDDSRLGGSVTTLTHLVNQHSHSHEMIEKQISSPENDNEIALDEYETVTHFDSPHLPRRAFPRLPPVQHQKQPSIPSLPQSPQDTEDINPPIMPPRSPPSTDTFRRIPTPPAKPVQATADETIDSTPKRNDQSRKRRRRRRRKQQEEESAEPMIDTNEGYNMGTMKETLAQQTMIDQDEQELWFRRKATMEYHKYISGEESSFHSSFHGFSHQLPPIGTPILSSPFMPIPLPSHTLATEHQAPGYIPEEDEHQSNSSVIVEEIDSESESSESQKSENSELLTRSKTERSATSEKVSLRENEEKITKESRKWHKPHLPHIRRHYKVAPSTSIMSQPPINMATNLAWLDTINGPQLMSVMPLPLHPQQQLTSPQYVFPVTPSQHLSPQSHPYSLTSRPHSRSHSKTQPTPVSLSHSQSTTSSLPVSPQKLETVNEDSPGVYRQPEVEREGDPGIQLTKSETDFFDGPEGANYSKEESHTPTQSMAEGQVGKGDDTVQTAGLSTDAKEMRIQRMIKEAFGSTTDVELGHSSKEQRSRTSSFYPHMYPATPHQVQPMLYATPQIVLPSPASIPMRGHRFLAGNSTYYNYNPPFPGHFIPLNISTPNTRMQRPGEH